MYLGGKEGGKIYFGKPVIYDSDNAHYMYPNDARLRNMTYGTTIHYDVDIEIIYYDKEKETMITDTMTLDKIYLGRFPIMLKSNLCILKSLASEVCFNMGECRSDDGGYFIIDGKEKVIIPQERFADNTLYIRKNKSDNMYSHTAEIRSISEDASKPMRTTSVRIVAPSPGLTNNQIVVDIPNVRKPIPLFIVMRALGIISDKAIIETCLLDLERNKDYVDLFIPSVHDANKIFDQRSALEFIKTFTKRQNIMSVLDILMNYFLPHIGVNNYIDKGYFIGFMVYKLLRVFTNEDKPTDRDNFKYKRIEQSGKLIYDLFREYYLLQNHEIWLAMDREYYDHRGEYSENFTNLIEANYREFFKNRAVEKGFKKAFKGNWGAQSYTKRVGVVQDLNRLSWNSFISQMRKLNLPLDASAKVVGPRHLHGSQWGYIDPVDTPDGGNIGLHKHLSIACHITSGFSGYPLIKWLRANTPLRLLQECTTKYLSSKTKVLVNGNWIGVVVEPIETMDTLKFLRRNGIIPVYTSITFEYAQNELYIYTDGGRLTRPIYYIHNHKPSYDRAEMVDKLNSGHANWTNLITGFHKKDDEYFDIKQNKLYDLKELYGEGKKIDLEKDSAMIDYLDTSEEESSLIAIYPEDLKKNKLYTHIEIHPSLLLGVMGNMVIYPENNPYARDAFSCGQSRQAVSLYHSNYQMRIDKMGVVLNSGQIPLLKSRYLDLVNKEQQPYGVNTIVAIMSYTGYNVEDAILINKGAVDRGLFRTTYYSMYEAREESSKVSGSMVNSYFTDVSTQEVVGIKPGYDYSYLDKSGLVKENTALDDKVILIGKVTNSENVNVDDSVKSKKGQLGFVDKSFITDGEEGFRIGKVRIREERIPNIGDKMASRAGQKGTIGLIIPEDDMPFTHDGVRPDLIINPHAIPSRMTIGQLIESLFGKACCEYGAFGDCTAFTSKGSNIKTYGDMLTRVGFHSSGNQILYNGMTGQQLSSSIYIGPTYYMRLKHMVKDKINHRARGPNAFLTRQSVHGRANDGGLRVGEMERDAIISHGAAHFLSESFLERSDEYYMAVCNKTGVIAVYNPSKNIFLSPQADGPIKFHTTLDGKQNVEMVSKYGRSFSVLRIPYTLKLLIQELQTMNIQMRIITDDNVDNVLSLSYSDNIVKLTDNDIQFTPIENTDYISQYVNKYRDLVNRIVSKENQKGSNLQIPRDIETDAEIINKEEPAKEEMEAPVLLDGPPDPKINVQIEGVNTESDDSVPFAPGSPYRGESISQDSKDSELDSYTKFLNEYETTTSSDSSGVPPPPPPPEDSDSSALDVSLSIDEDKNDFGSDELNSLYINLPVESKKQIDGLSKNEQISVLKRVLVKKKERDLDSEEITSILDVEKEVTADEEKGNDDDDINDTDSGETKKVIVVDNDI